MNKFYQIFLALTLSISTSIIPSCPSPTLNCQPILSLVSLQTLQKLTDKRTAAFRQLHNEKNAHKSLLLFRKIIAECPVSFTCLEPSRNDSCNTVPNYRGSRNDHLTIHHSANHERNFACLLCDASFGYLTTLIEHAKETHIKPIPSEIPIIKMLDEFTKQCIGQIYEAVKQQKMYTHFNDHLDLMPKTLYCLEPKEICGNCENFHTLKALNKHLATKSFPRIPKPVQLLSCIYQCSQTRTNLTHLIRHMQFCSLRNTAEQIQPTVLQSTEPLPSLPPLSAPEILYSGVASNALSTSLNLTLTDLMAEYFVTETNQERELIELQNLSYD